MTALVVVLVVAGMVLLALEILVIPGFGVAGVAGLLCLAAGALLAWRTLGPGWGLGIVGGTVIVSGLLLYLVVKTRLGRGVALSEQLTEPAVVEDRSAYVGRRGVAVSPLRPSGTVRFGDEKLPVLAEGRLVNPGTLVEVVRVEAGRLVVAPVRDGDPAEGRSQETEAGD